MQLERRWCSGVSPARPIAKPCISPRLRVRICKAHADACVSSAVSGNNHSVALRPLFDGVRAHESAVSAIKVLEDEKDGTKVVVSASMDKTIAAWRLLPNQDVDTGQQPFCCEVQKISAPGGPIFAIAPSRPLFSPRITKGVKAPGSLTIFCGNAAKQVVSWQPFMPSFNPLTLDGHKGWVRAVATYDKYLFSCGCNYLRQWDCTFATPKLVNKIKLFTGDILAIAAGKGYVYTAGVDGCIRSWSVDKGSGAMAEAAVQGRAHDGRVCSLICHEGFVYSSGADGSIKLWAKDTLQLVAQALNAHGGEKVHCLAVAGNGLLYSGGDDALIKAWCPLTLQPLPRCEPTGVHSGAVRMLSAGKSELLVAGDSEGYVNFYQVPPAPLAWQQQQQQQAHGRAASSSDAMTVHTLMSLGSHTNITAAAAAGCAAGLSSNMAVHGCASVEARSSTARMSACEFSDSLSPQPSSVQDTSSTPGSVAAAAAAAAAEPTTDQHYSAALAATPGDTCRHLPGTSAVSDSPNALSHQQAAPGMSTAVATFHAATCLSLLHAMSAAAADHALPPAIAGGSAWLAAAADREDAAGNAAAATAAMAYRSMRSGASMQSAEGTQAAVVG